MAMQAFPHQSDLNNDHLNHTNVHKHKKHHHKKSKSKKSKKHHQKHKKKAKVYSERKIDQLLKNENKDGQCNRLNCSSKLSIAKTCLKTKADHRRHKDCFRAFCAYGCNDEDYQTRPDVFDFCNQTCSSKKYKAHGVRP